MTRLRTAIWGGMAESRVSLVCRSCVWLTLLALPACGSDRASFGENDGKASEAEPALGDAPAPGPADPVDPGANPAKPAVGPATSPGLPGQSNGTPTPPSQSQSTVEASPATPGAADSPEAFAVDLASEPTTPSDEAEDSVTAPNQTDEPVATNAFVAAEHDPLSTFAIDVDTASYDLFRQYVNNNVMLPAQMVRLEEFVNYFHYDYTPPAQDSQEPFTIALAAAPSLIGQGTTLLRVGIQGKLPTKLEKRPANLVFLVDTSGSMAEELPLVQQLLSDTLGILEPTDTISLVTYASSTGVVLAPTAVSESAVITQAFGALGSGGSTAGSAGLDLAYQQAEAAFLEGGINHVVLCTDGDFNVGPSSTEELLDQITDQRKSGVTLTALGFGTEGVNDAMLETVSNAGNGIYGVISDTAQAQDYVEERMLQNLTYIAKDVKIQVEFNPEQVQAYRLLGYEDRAIADQDFRNDVVDAGEIGAGHRVTAIYELVMAGDPLPDAANAPAVESGETYSGEVEIDPAALVLVKVRYKRVDAAEEDAAYETVRALNPEDVAASHSDLDLDFQWATAVAAFAEILKGSPYADPSKLDAIDAIVQAQQTRDDERAEFSTLFTTARSLL